MPSLKIVISSSDLTPATQPLFILSTIPPRQDGAATHFEISLNMPPRPKKLTMPSCQSVDDTSEMEIKVM
jgi:hypothetical protein